MSNRAAEWRADAADVAMVTSGPSPSSDSEPDSSRAETSLAPSPPSLAELPPETLYRINSTIHSIKFIIDIKRI